MSNRVWKGWAVSVLAFGAAAACDGKDPVKPEPPKPGIGIVAGASVTDTTLGKPVQALVVEVRGEDGKPQPGLVVRFEGVPVRTPVVGGSPVEMYVARVEDNRLASFMADTTDAQGRVQALVQMGTLAGPARVAITVPTLGLQDTARYTILPASAARVTLAPRDTVLYVGKSYTLRGGVTDRWGNRREDPITFTAAAGLTVDGKGSVTTTETGRTLVVAQAQGKVDTVRVSIPPPGSLAVFSHKSADSSGVAIVNLDGSGFRRLAPTSYYYLPDHMAPSWNPNGTEVVYHDRMTTGSSNPRVYRVDMNGTVSRLIQNPPASLSSEEWPLFTRDGRSIYLFGGGSLWRVAPDGSSPTSLGPSGGSAWHPSPSPDGQRLAYVAQGYGGYVVRVLNLATQAVSALDVPGNTPRWSPKEDLIAYRRDDATLWKMKPDGSGQQMLSPAGRRYDYGFNWSPDGEWIVAYNLSGFLDVINVRTGAVIPLPFSSGLTNPSWKP